MYCINLDEVEAEGREKIAKAKSSDRGRDVGRLESADGELHVWHRYSEFYDTLISRLNLEGKLENEFPKKTWSLFVGRDLSVEFMEERRKALDDFLCEALRRPEIASSKEIRTFLQFDRLEQNQRKKSSSKSSFAKETGVTFTPGQSPLPGWDKLASRNGK